MRKMTTLYPVLLVLLFQLSACTLWADKPDTYIVPLKDGEYSIKVEAYVSPYEIKPKLQLTYYWLKSKKIHSTQGGYSGLLLHGEFIQYYKNGQLLEKGQFHEGLKAGTWKSWHPNGLLKEIHLYRNGQLQGTVKKYDENGRLILKGKYKKGRRHGKFYFYEDGKLTRTKVYKAGALKNTHTEKEKRKNLFKERKQKPEKEKLPKEKASDPPEKKENSEENEPEK